LVPTIDGIPLVQVIFSRTGRLLGAAHVREIPKTIWVDADFAARQKALDQALPKRINLMTSLTRDEQRMLVLSYSDRDPGTYYLFDAKKKSLGKIAERMPWIKTEQMAPMYATKYQARDGETIHGYL